MADETDEATLIERLRDFCVSKDISTDGALAITIQKNRSTEYASLVVDFTTDTLAPNYPVAFGQRYREGKTGEYLYAYHEGLDSSPLKDMQQGAAPPPEDNTSASPFCCTRMCSYRERRTSHDSKFSNFVAGTGSAPGVVFQVKAQVDNGPMLSEKYYTLEDGVRREVVGRSFRQKIHVFKNYKCTDCDRFFGVDLGRARSTMRQSDGRGWT